MIKKLIREKDELIKIIEDLKFKKNVHKAESLDLKEHEDEVFQLRANDFSEDNNKEKKMTQSNHLHSSMNPNVESNFQGET